MWFPYLFFAGNDIDYKVSIAADAVTKPGHYTNCAKATHHLQPRLSKHYGTADVTARQLHANNSLNLSVLAPTASQHGGEQTCCSSELHCARTDSRRLGPRDIYGVVGASCVHGVAVRKSFMDLHSPENFSYYLIMLWLVLLAAGGRVRDVYIDFGCRLGITWARFIEHKRLTSPPGYSVPPYMSAVRIIVNWLHAQGHNPGCQLRHSGRHTEGAAWRVGEHAEQLWSLLKVRKARVTRTPSVPVKISICQSLCKYICE